MKVRYNKLCDCDPKRSIPEVTYDPPEGGKKQLIADFYIVCKDCGKRWHEQLEVWP